MGLYPKVRAFVQESQLFDYEQEYYLHLMNKFS